MTSPQRTRLYFLAWQDAVRANWTGAPMRLSPTPANPEQARRVHRLAVKLARAEGVSVAGDHLRHAVHIMVLGTDKSSRDLTNMEIDTLLAAFRQLAGTSVPCRPDPLRSRASVVAPRPHAKVGRRLPPSRPRHIQPDTPGLPDDFACGPCVPTSITSAHVESPPTVSARDFDPYASVPVGRGPLGATRTGD